MKVLNMEIRVFASKLTTKCVDNHSMCIKYMPIIRLFKYILLILYIRDYKRIHYEHLLLDKLSTVNYE